MLEIIITWLNTKVTATNYFNKVLCLAEMIEREKLIFPATYINNEYKRIDLDPKGSISYWRKNGDVSYNQQENGTKVGQIEYVTNVPLKLICFVKKDKSNNDIYFADKIVEVLKSQLSTNTAVLNLSLKAKKCLILATKYNTNGREVSDGEYKGIDYEPRYTHAYFSVDFDVQITSNQNCFNNLCT